MHTLPPPPPLSPSSSSRFLKNLKNVGRFRRIYVHTHKYTPSPRGVAKSCNTQVFKTAIPVMNLVIFRHNFLFCFHFCVGDTRRTLVDTRMSATTKKDFTHLSAQSVQTIAEAFGIVISDDVAKAFAPDVEYRLRDIIQEALKCTKRSRRTVLTTEVIIVVVVVVVVFSSSSSVTRVSLCISPLTNCVHSRASRDGLTFVGVHTNALINLFLFPQFKIHFL